MCFQGFLREKRFKQRFYASAKLIAFHTKVAWTEFSLKNLKKRFSVAQDYFSIRVAGKYKVLFFSTSMK
jgi:hypothetical protein